MITTQRALRAAFWAAHPQASRRLIRDYSGKGRMYCTDTRVLWCDFVDHLQRNGEISEALANRATLQPSRASRASLQWEIQGNYGNAWETECTESTRAEALQRLREYRKNGPGDYRIRARRILQSNEG